jgi:hypothetical protein
MDRKNAAVPIIKTMPSNIHENSINLFPIDLTRDILFVS